jgi:hypothetical protein
MPRGISSQEPSQVLINAVTGQAVGAPAPVILSTAKNLIMLPRPANQDESAIQRRRRGTNLAQPGRAGYQTQEHAERHRCDTRLSPLPPELRSASLP